MLIWVISPDAQIGLKTFLVSLIIQKNTLNLNFLYHTLKLSWIFFLKCKHGCVSILLICVILRSLTTWWATKTTSLSWIIELIDWKIISYDVTMECYSLIKFIWEENCNEKKICKCCTVVYIIDLITLITQYFIIIHLTVQFQSSNFQVPTFNCQIR